ncbi:uncharacterized protein LOC143533785 [Bidens hawaiensis]|uniref:uncharacterized protein LOC143533785 n=1 Tax=Bidens hawaiensis TaxID=980011 RepID=UPI00404AF3F5
MIFHVKRFMNDLLNVWQNIDKFQTNVLGELKKKPLFTWKKYISGAWRDRNYSACNTLLISDHVTALLNPPNTSISLANYDPENKEDDLLGPNGEMRVFLDGLADAKDVQSYVKDHPIGDPAITSSHADWDYYSNIIRSFGKKESSDH